MTVMSLMICMGVFAQDYDYLWAPKENEEVLGTINQTRTSYSAHIYNTEAYNTLLDQAKKEYPNKRVDIRELKVKRTWMGNETSTFALTGKVVWIRSKKELAEEFEKTLSQALNKAIGRVAEGSRMAIDQITLNSGMDSERLKDQIIDILLEKGYRVVAKEYLQKLDKEIKDAIESGSFNPETMVEGNNFSAVGYFINVKVTESSIRVQVVDVSKGEYVGNATVNF